MGVIYMGYKVTRTDLLCWECRRMFVPMKEPFIGIARQGFPASLNMMTVALGAFVITYFISQFGQSAVAAYGIALRVEQMILIPTIGLNIASLVLVGQNNGAKKYDRVRLAVRKVHIYGSVLLAIGSVAILLGGRALMGIFTSDSEVLRMGMEYLYIMAFLLHSYLILFINVSALQGLKKPMFALYIGLFRQLVLAYPIFTFFAFTLGWGLHGVWWGIFSINWLSAIITYLYARRVFSRLGKEPSSKATRQRSIVPGSGGVPILRKKG
jgi:Na+-driven multidrug efflux pump